MKNYITFLLWLIVSIGYSQNSNVYVELFNVNSSALNNGKIHYFSNVGDTSINFSVVIGRNIGHVGNPTQVLALAVFDNNGLEYAASDTIALTQANFTAFDGTATPFINSSFTLKENKKEGVLKFKYRFRINGGGYDDWTNWFYATKTYQTQQYQPPIPATTFAGPDQICDEGIYTITNPGTISLENATGVANLTNLGNNQWKVERINNAVGTVVLKSLVGSNTYEKNIRIGNQAPTSITGNSFSLDWSRSYTFTVNTVDANSTLEIVKEGAPSVTFTRLDNNRFTLSTPPKPNSNDPITPVYVLNIKARVIDPECGNSEYIHQEIRVGSTIPFE
ncbi:hypothetical protein [Sphingobacterium sp. SGR-19]|uniref:hypothetical protein n=1 Tax=Sphingobacterium sp. SGR-19 TaxID=2710886 RepID=UPI0013EC5FE2|nr:hypothetical protein [Sphingobacterium sp. SGR-19]NGM67304.1 hypothetical protein [Sphingobacterium sp. SGR-19]